MLVIDFFFGLLSDTSLIANTLPWHLGHSVNLHSLRTGESGSGMSQELLTHVLSLHVYLPHAWIER